MRYDSQHLLSLIPAVYRLRDYLRDDPPHGPLEALIDAIAEQINAIEINIEQLYDDLFIETCADWIVPYIGDAIGYQPLSGATAAVSSPRAEVANTIGYRRRKGTLRVLEMLAGDVTDWPAVAVECFTRLAQTEYLNHLRPSRTSTASLRTPLPALADRPIFLDLPHAIDVRSIGSRRGVWNIPNIAIYLHRIRAFNLIGGVAAAIDSAHPERFTFHPLGLDAPLFQPLRLLTADQERANKPQNVPSPASRRLLYAELEERRTLPDSVVEEHAVAFTKSAPVAAIAVGGVAIDPKVIDICDLSEWTGSATAGIRASIDPHLGRIVLGSDPGTQRVSVDYWYGSVGEFGAGAYARPDEASAIDVAPADDLSAVINAAVAAARPEVRVPNSATFKANITISLNADQKFAVRAASTNRPVLNGTLTIDLKANASFTLIGFVVAHGLIVTGGPGVVDLQQCTVIDSGTGAISWQGNAGGGLAVMKSLLGPLRLNPLVSANISASVIDSGGNTSAAIESTIAGKPAGLLSMDQVTAVGTISVREIKVIQNSLLTGKVTSTRTQQGCIRFTYLPFNSATPHRYECQPETAVRRALTTARDAGATSLQITALTDATNARIRPEFTSVILSDPAYMQLGPRCAPEISGGAEDGSEMGVYSSLQQSIREKNLQKRLAEYLRISLEVGVLDAS